MKYNFSYACWATESLPQLSGFETEAFESMDMKFMQMTQVKQTKYVRFNARFLHFYAEFTYYILICDA